MRPYVKSVTAVSSLIVCFAFLYLCKDIADTFLQYAWSPPQLQFLPQSHVPLMQKNNFSDSLPAPKGDTPEGNERVAICLVGGARAFELTGLSIKRHVLDLYNHSDVFLHVPLDENVHKVTLLQGVRNLAVARIFVNSKIDETFLFRSVLTGRGSPHGIQGLLQYFRLVEGCLGMIKEFEDLHNFKYDWIIRARVDGYWNQPLAPMKSFHPHSYHVPQGSEFGGLNDRLGIGTRNASWIALSRLSMLPELYWQGNRQLYSETAFKAQLDISNVHVQRDTFPFCVLSIRKYGWPGPGAKWNVPVASINSSGPLNGAKCRPCIPKLVGKEAEALIANLSKQWGWPGEHKDFQMCRATGDWPNDWQKIFDTVAGPEAQSIRQYTTSRTKDQCVQDMTMFSKSWEVWDAPSPEIICSQGSSIS